MRCLAATQILTALRGPNAMRTPVGSVFPGNDFRERTNYSRGKFRSMSKSTSRDYFRSTKHGTASAGDYPVLNRTNLSPAQARSCSGGGAMNYLCLSL